MKPRNREINIFNMSLLDILCGALGAFCFLMLALFPYYAKNAGSTSQTPEETKKLKQELEEARRELEQAKSKEHIPPNSEQITQENQELKKKLAETRKQLTKATGDKPTLLLIRVTHNPPGSIEFDLEPPHNLPFLDLTGFKEHLQGFEVKGRTKFLTVGISQSSFSILVPNAVPGAYRFWVKPEKNRMEFGGAVFYGDGTAAFRRVVTQRAEKVYLATIEVQDGGKVFLR